MNTLPWDSERYRGLGESSGATCAIPECGAGVHCLGLCSSCYRCWRRYGKEGLEKRMYRLNVGDRDSRKPMNVAEAKKRLINAALSLGEVEPGDNKDWDYRVSRLWRVAVHCAHASGRLQQEYNARYKAKFIKTFGIDAWRAKDRAYPRKKKVQ
jgi:hypothetical protein